MNNWHPDIPKEYRNQIVTGDARELTKRIPDESIDLIFTDPVYDRIEDYEWLAETAARVLKPDSTCLVWIANPRIEHVLRVMGKYLAFVMPFVYTVPGKGYMMFSRTTFVWSTLCLWFEKGHSRKTGAKPDTVIGGGRTAFGHKWNKNPDAFINWTGIFPGTVFDPFTGGGTIPAVCKILSRNYIAFEIDPATAEMARERVLNTQPPLFVPEPEQLALSIGERR